MTLRWCAVLFVAAGVALCGCAANRSGLVADDRDPLHGLAWLTGAWVGGTAARQSEEYWTTPSGGSMFGVNRTIEVDGSHRRTVFFEWLRIEANAEGVAYLASPMGRQPPTPFRMVELAGQRAVFENPEHDFPTRIIYWRQGDELHARIEGGEAGGERSSGWSWRRREW